MKRLAVWISNNRYLRLALAWNVSFYATPALWSLRWLWDAEESDLLISFGPIEFQYTLWKIDGHYVVDNGDGITWEMGP